MFWRFFLTFLPVIIESESTLKSSEEALTHLEEVISHVVSEAVEYADKPPEERTLPALVRKSMTQPRSRPANMMENYGQMGMANNGAHLMGIGQMGAYGFPQVQGQMHPNSRFASKIDSIPILLLPYMFYLVHVSLQCKIRRCYNKIPE